MNTMIAEWTETSNQASFAQTERPRIVPRLAQAATGIEAERTPFAAGLLPYGLSLASLLRP